MSDYFVFGDIDTRNYEGIYVYFDDVDATPSRVGEFIEIPGRNGSFYLDKGRYEDVTHTYDIVALTMEAGRDLINAISSQVGYHRLEDSFNPDEFYSAVFTSEVEPNVPTDREQMTFKLMFTRKPQRFLTSGETAVSVASGGTLTNPTLFESSPLIEVAGDGEMNLSGESITVYNSELGEIDLTPVSSKTYTTSNYSISYKDRERLAMDFLESGDPFTWSGGEYSYPFSTRGNRFVDSGDGGFIGTATAGTYLAAPTCTDGLGVQDWSTQKYYIGVKIGTVSFTFGTSQTITDSATISVQYKAENGTTYTTAYTVSLTLAYNGTDTINMTLTVLNSSQDKKGVFPYGYSEGYISDPTFKGDSSRVPGRLFIDLDIGEAYFVSGGEVLDGNSYVFFGGNMPKLEPGSNTITYDNTITSLKITPRWWKV